MKRFFYASMGILALAASFQLGTQSVKASGMGTVATMTSETRSGTTYIYTLTDEGDLYYAVGGSTVNSYQLKGNIFNQTTKTKDATWGEVKEMFR